MNFKMAPMYLFSTKIGSHMNFKMAPIYLFSTKIGSYMSWDGSISTNYTDFSQLQNKPKLIEQNYLGIWKYKKFDSVRSLYVRYNKSCKSVNIWFQYFIGETLLFCIEDETGTDWLLVKTIKSVIRSDFARYSLFALVLKLVSSIYMNF